MARDRERVAGRASLVDTVAAPTPSPGKATLVQLREAPQRRTPATPGKLSTAVQLQSASDARSGAPGSDHALDVAARGIAGSGGPLPHLDRIQALFGRHDVRGVTAHTG